MPNIVSSTTFCYRNVEKAEKKDNDTSRIALVPVVIGQLRNSYAAIKDTVSAFDKAAGPEHPSYLTRLSQAEQKIIQSDALFSKAAKAASWAGENVNPLIIGASAVDVLTSDDKEGALMRNGAGLGVMFAAEKLAKTALSDKNIQKSKWFMEIPEKLSQFATKHGLNKVADFITKEHVKEIFPKAAHGGALVALSITGYTVGSKLGIALANHMGHHISDGHC